MDYATACLPVQSDGTCPRRPCFGSPAATPSWIASKEKFEQRRRLRKARFVTDAQNRDNEVISNVISSPATARLVDQARRRLLLQSVIDAAVWGLVGSALVLGLMFVFGAGVVHWAWSIVVGAGVAAFAWFRSRRVPDAYAAAVVLDTACASGDLLSTAWHFGQHSDSTASPFLPPVVERAELQAQSIDLATVLPLRKPSGSWALLATLVIALGAFGLRYGILHSFDPRASIVAVQFDSLTGASVVQRKAPPKQPQASRPWFPQPEALTLPLGDQAETKDVPQQAEEIPDSTLQNSSLKSGPGNQKGQKGSSSPNGNNSQQSPSDDAEQSASNEQSPAGAPDPQRGQNSNGQKPSDRNKDSNGLMDKMRDALANLMDKMKMDPKQGEQQADNQKGQNGQSSKQGQQQAQQQGRQQGQRQGNPSESGDMQKTEGQGDSAQTQQAKSRSDQNADAPKSQQNSGMGKQEGRKDTAAAEEAEAIGKLSELLGKRSQSVQGEMTVEVNNSRNQQVRTPYSNRNAVHVEAGGDLSRDEVPMELQHYVQRYYEQVRKVQPNPAAPSGNASRTPGAPSPAPSGTQPSSRH